MSPLAIEPLRGARGWGLRLVVDGVAHEIALPVRIGRYTARYAATAHGYGEMREDAAGLVGTLVVRLWGASVECRDRWAIGPDRFVVERHAHVIEGPAHAHPKAPGRRSGIDVSPLGFDSALMVPISNAREWSDVELFVPGVSYGDARPVAASSMGTTAAERLRLRRLAIREDRMAAPTLTVRTRDGATWSIEDLDPDLATIDADGAVVEGGETIIDDRIRVAALGLTLDAQGIHAGIWMPGSEGGLTYTTERLPLRQVRAWRRRGHPLAAGVSHRFRVAIRIERTHGPLMARDRAWRRAWASAAPCAVPADTDLVLAHATRVLSDAVQRRGERAGVPLQLDAVTGAPSGSRAALMGFVGANTDAAFVLLRMAGRAPGAVVERYREDGLAILRSFSSIPMDPPAGEGFDLATGRLTTYRKWHGSRAVYLRSIADGCLAALRAADLVDDARLRERLVGWATSAGGWFLDQQDRFARLPRAWRVGTGAVLDPSTTATAIAVPFLVALASVSEDDRFLDAAAGAAGHAWHQAGRHGWFAGATLDNPDVIDKEAGLYVLRGSLALFDATGDRVWLERAAASAAFTETWTVLRDIPMPVDADPRKLHWKPAARVIGQQLIATGVSMVDGFLAADAAAFARLAILTGDEHYLDVARLVTHGTKAMMALPGRTWDLAGPGWMQEHWSLAPRRGRGLNRDWLPWVSVAAVNGILDVEALGPTVTGEVLGRGRRHPSRGTPRLEAPC